MLDVQAARRFEFKLSGKEESMEADEALEERLEAALERIAKVIDAPDPVAAEVAARLDRIIATLREALGK
jgi:hypothetical protein